MGKTKRYIELGKKIKEMGQSLGEVPAGDEFLGEEISKLEREREELYYDLELWKERG